MMIATSQRVPVCHGHTHTYITVHNTHYSTQRHVMPESDLSHSSKREKTSLSVLLYSLTAYVLSLTLCFPPTLLHQYSHKHTHTRTHTHIRTCTHTHTHTQRIQLAIPLTSILTQRHKHTNTNTHATQHTHTHTHTPKRQ